MTEKQLVLLRSGYPVKEIPFSQISKVVVSRGIRTKFPIRSLLFGLAIFVVVYFLIPEKDFIIFDPANALVEISYILLAMGELGVVFWFLFAIGIASIVHALRKTLVMKVYPNDGGYEVFSIKSFAKTNHIFDLINFLGVSFHSRFTNKSLYGKSP